jgi:hypothetical protein
LRNLDQVLAAGLSKLAVGTRNYFFIFLVDATIQTLLSATVCQQSFLHEKESPLKHNL